MSRLLEAAQKLSAAEARVRAWGQMNSPRDPAERIKQDAAYKLAVAALDRAKAEYDGLLRRASDEEVEEAGRLACGN